MNKQIIRIACLALAASPILTAHAEKPPTIRATTKVSGEAPAGASVDVFEVEDSKGPLGIARAAVGDAERTVKRIFSFSGDAIERPLIISSSSIDEEEIGNLEEDMNIMSRILEKATDDDDDNDRKAMGIHLWAIGQGNKGARNLYLDGHGAIFFLNVNIPLAPTSAKPEPEEKKESASTSWEKARKELYGRGEGEPEVFERKIREAEPYNAEKVTNLKNALIDTLKNATHIRGLKENETVTLVIQGVSGGSRVRTITGKGRRDMHVESYAFSAAPGWSPASKSVMTLRAKKSDIDAFAKGRLDEDEFRKKVTVAAYRTGGRGESPGK